MKPSGKLRIVSGKYRGKRLNTPAGQNVRPTGDRVRESLFNILEHLTVENCSAPTLWGAKVLDRFAGTGALGFEGLSRGAKEVWFIEKCPLNQQLIKKNYQTITGLNRLSSNVRIGNESILGLGNALHQPFDIILCDPPYGFSEWETLVQNFLCANLAGPGTLLVTETDHKHAFPDLSCHWQTLKDRHIGRTRLQILKKTSAT